jgi:hypothetical protein
MAEHPYRLEAAGVVRQRFRFDPIGLRPRPTPRVPLRPHRDHTASASSDSYGQGGIGGKRYSATLRAIRTTNKYKGEQVEVALFGGDYRDRVLTAYCLLDDVAHLG